MLLCPSLPEFTELPYHYLAQAGTYRIPTLDDVFKEILKQIKEMLPNLLGVGRRHPNFSIIAESIACIPRNRSERYGIALGPTVRVVSAVGVEGVFDFEMPDFAIGVHIAIGSAWEAALTVILPIEPAGSAAI